MDPAFEVHMLNEDGKGLAKAIDGNFHELWSTLQALVPASSREMSIVHTKLEEACFFAKKAMANVPTNQAQVS